MSLGGQYLTLSTVEQDVTQHPRFSVKDIWGAVGVRRRLRKRQLSVKVRQAVVLLSASVVFVTLPFLAWSQSRLGSGDSSGETGNCNSRTVEPDVCASAA